MDQITFDFKQKKPNASNSGQSGVNGVTFYTEWVDWECLWLIKINFGRLELILVDLN